MLQKILDMLIRNKIIIIFILIMSAVSAILGYIFGGLTLISNNS